MGTRSAWTCGFLYSHISSGWMTRWKGGSSSVTLRAAGERREAGGPGRARPPRPLRAPHSQEGGAEQEPHAQLGRQHRPPPPHGPGPAPGSRLRPAHVAPPQPRRRARPPPPAGTAAHCGPLGRPAPRSHLVRRGPARHRTARLLRTNQPYCAGRARAYACVLVLRSKYSERRSRWGSPQQPIAELAAKPEWPCQGLHGLCTPSTAPA